MVSQDLVRRKAVLYIGGGVVAAALLHVLVKRMKYIVSSHSDVVGKRMLDLVDEAGEMPLAEGPAQERTVTRVLNSGLELVTIHPPNYGETTMIPDFTNHKKMAAYMGAMCRTSLNLGVDSVANRLVARRWLMARLDEVKDLRLKHRVAILPLALEVVFIPSNYEVEARDMSKSEAVTRRLESYAEDRWAYEGPSWVHPFGRVVTRPKPLGA